MPLKDLSKAALRTVNQIPAMIAYWDTNECCIFANNAYLHWFGKSPEQMSGITLKELLGPIYDKNLPYIKGALSGEKQIFERTIKTPLGDIRESIATYTPDIIDGVIYGFSVQVADVTLLRQREKELIAAIAERDFAISEVRKLEGLLPICSWCKKIRDEAGNWNMLEKYISDRTNADFTHGICEDCKTKLISETNAPK